MQGQQYRLLIYLGVNPPHFSAAQIKDFQELKSCLILAPMLKVYDPELPIRVQTDASKLVVGALFEQLYSSNWHPSQYISKSLNDAESQYCATERELLGCILALQRWRQYLIGKYFDVLTNHAPNQYILSQQKLSHCQVHWVYVLAEYAANFIYKPGHVNSAPDALSHIPGLNAVLDIHDNCALLEAIRTAQLLNQNTQFVQFRYMASNPTSINNGVVVKKMANTCPLVIPGDALSQWQKVLEELLMSPLGGHLGYRKLLELVRAHFWWPYLNQQVQQFCGQRVIFQQAKVVTQKPLGLLQPLVPPSRLFEQVTMDLVTHFPQYNSYDAVFTIIDRFSKYATFLPCSTTSTALDLAQIFYDNIVCKFGMRNKIISDCYSRVLSRFWQSLMKMLKCKVVISSGYHPQTDGQSERFHRSIEQILRYQVAPNQ